MSNRVLDPSDGTTRPPQPGQSRNARLSVGRVPAWGSRANRRDGQRIPAVSCHLPHRHRPPLGSIMTVDRESDDHEPASALPFRTLNVRVKSGPPGRPTAASRHAGCPPPRASRASPRSTTAESQRIRQPSCRAESLETPAPTPRAHSPTPLAAGHPRWVSWATQGHTRGTSGDTPDPATGEAASRRHPRGMLPAGEAG